MQKKPILVKLEIEPGGPDYGFRVREITGAVIIPASDFNPGNTKKSDRVFTGGRLTESEATTLANNRNYKVTVRSNHRG
jgi:hypothetical protein